MVESFLFLRFKDLYYVINTVILRTTSWCGDGVVGPPARVQIMVLTFILYGSPVQSFYQNNNMVIFRYYVS